MTVPHILDEVRALTETYKPDWNLIVREHARRTLLVTGYLSAADFEALGVPDEHCNLPGAQIGALAGAGYMEPVTFRRWSAEDKASRKSGKYWVYRITHKGKEKLSPPTGSGSGPSGHVAPAVRSGGKEVVGTGTEEEERATSDTSGAGPGDQPGVHHAGAVDRGQPKGKSDQGRHPASSPAAAIDPPEHSQDAIAGEGTAASTEGAPTDSSHVAGGGVPGVLQLDIPRESGSSAYDPFEDAA